MRTLLIGFIIGIAALSAARNGTDERAGTRRFGVFAGATNGGANREMLRYAASDAQSLAKVFSAMGGMASDDRVLIIEPDTLTISNAFAEMSRAVGAVKSRVQRTEFVFYYSGHSDSEGLILGREKYAYRDLKRAVSSIGADIRIVILDSCESGAFTRYKGGMKQQPLIIEKTPGITGYAVLTSSSADEVSQESDIIGGSYFTHHLIAALRGAADINGDRSVSLNEAYQYTFRETLAKTSRTEAGPQHPFYDIQLTGSGEVALTELARTDGTLIIAGDISGRVAVQGADGAVIAETVKSTGKPLEMGLERGSYTIRVRNGRTAAESSFIIAKADRRTVTMSDLKPVVLEETAVRGTRTPPAAIPFNASLIPSFRAGRDYIRTANNLAVGLIGSDCDVLTGAAIAPVMNLAYEEANGVQLTLGFNAAGTLRGLQCAWAFNSAVDVYGAQSAFLFNKARTVNGIQFALINIADDAAVPLGLVNIISNGQMHGAMWFDEFNIASFAFKSGSRYVFTFTLIGFAHDKVTQALGIGVELPADPFYLGLDASVEYIFGTKVRTYTDASGEHSDRFTASGFHVRLIAGMKFYEHLGIFAGFTYRFLGGTNWDLASHSLPYDFNDTASVRHIPGFVIGMQF
ncbi:MAG: caspase family protein [Spirochaetes bacterium]|nr:caspase family protein [Spirochaetota bacterium]